jgi:hypothetical protein
VSEDTVTGALSAMACGALRAELDQDGSSGPRWHVSPAKTNALLHIRIRGTQTCFEIRNLGRGLELHV